MRLSDAWLHRRQTKALDPNHRLPPWPTEDATRDRSNRWLGVTRGNPSANGLDHNKGEYGQSEEQPN
jgi:hypothetical protein